MLYIDRKMSFAFEELTEKALKQCPIERIVLNFSFDVEEAFKTWSGQTKLQPSSPQKALTILRQPT